ncbi:hypothetical protein K443DRAFT_114150 [Laccaria amethystina LaAM-08-1]|uniref:Unplaced genomic scaffold K443scaffold_406, whole genome shotgun sequence n=1 Tax=Laccaria amethystina LaAM-08-1 TaxID=1095629 RepID=A0A0C9WNM7_9AGAR|nr:hypothetical protein K443DRAFT_114150 [Laccaria amethystina LaAM-08-1]
MFLLTSTARHIFLHIPCFLACIHCTLTTSDATTKPTPPSDNVTPAKPVGTLKERILKTFSFFPHNYIKHTTQFTVHLGFIYLGQLAIYCATDTIIYQFASTSNNFIDNDKLHHFSTYNFILSNFHIIGIPPTIHDFQLSGDEVNLTYCSPKSMKHSATKDAPHHPDTPISITSSSSNP